MTSSHSNFTFLQAEWPVLFTRPRWFEASFKVLVGPALHAKMDVMSRLGNNAVHSGQATQAALQKLSTLADELAQLRAEVAANKTANTATPDTHDYNDAQTHDLSLDARHLGK